MDLTFYFNKKGKTEDEIGEIKQIKCSNYDKMEEGLPQL